MFEPFSEVLRRGREEAARNPEAAAAARREFMKPKPPLPTSETIAARLASILTEWDYGRGAQMGDTDADIARREGCADVCDDVRALLEDIRAAWAARGLIDPTA